jgi:hypothetical protein
VANINHWVDVYLLKSLKSSENRKVHYYSEQYEGSDSANNDPSLIVNYSKLYHVTTG